MEVKPTQQERESLRRLVAAARSEDLGPGDVTGAMLPADMDVSGAFVAGQELIFCGGVFLDEIAAAYDERIETNVLVADGREAAAGAAVAEWAGPVRAVLAAERVALNFLEVLSGIATVTRRYVEAAVGTDVAVYDTRKTVPGWRAPARYAVRAGGGRNHRRGLYEAVLVKDNHLAALAAAGEADPIAAAGRQIARLEGRDDLAFVMIEVDALLQLEGALAAGADAILLDNMSAEQLAVAVTMRDAAGLQGKVVLEASGGVTLETIGRIAESGVERISVGALTHSAPAVDIGFDITWG